MSDSPTYHYYLKDHLGSNRVVVNQIDSVVQQTDYYPFGMAFNKSGSSDNKYLYNGKEMQEDAIGNGLLEWYDYGARFYDPALGRFMTIDPLAEEFSLWTPYHYVHNNPMMFIDPTGMSADWVHNEEEDKYEWMDNVTATENTPEGYRYVGSSDNDIVADLNLPQELESKTENRISAGLDGDNKVGVPVGTLAKTQGSISIKADVLKSKSNATSNNKEGKTFEGISVTANFSQSSNSANSGLKMNYKGYLAVKYGATNKSSMLGPLTGSNIYQTGTSPSQATVKIPANTISRGKLFYNATISVGTTNPSLLFSPRPIKMTWSMFKNPVIY